MTQGTREQKTNPMDRTICPECGMINDPIFSFCEECGCRLIEVDVHQEDTPVPDVQSTPQMASPSTRIEEPKKKSSKLTGVLAVILAIVIAAGYWGQDYISSIGLAHGGEISETVEEEVVTVEEPPIHELDTSQVSIISSDWDWDSCRKVGEGYQVDYILLVKNVSDEPVIELYFKVRDKTGASIGEKGETSNPLRGVGLVSPGGTGIMVGEVTVANKQTRADKSTYEITQAMTNKKVEDYKLPEGKITSCHGDNNDYYDISVVNTNGVTISKNSVVVTVFTKDGKIKESDATGKIVVGIGPGESLDQKDAFYDPNLLKYQDNKKKYVVYVIDKDYLTT